MSNHYQLAVIGSGAGGREATLLAARKGLQQRSLREINWAAPAFIAGVMLSALCKLARGNFETVGRADALAAKSTS
jgi:hypothetical protein